MLAPRLSSRRNERASGERGGGRGGAPSPVPIVLRYVNHRSFLVRHVSPHSPYHIHIYLDFRPKDLEKQFPTIQDSPS